MVMNVPIAELIWTLAKSVIARKMKVKRAKQKTSRLFAQPGREVLKMSKERCRRCHRRLKTPEAVATGYGSSCYKKLFGKTLKKASAKEQKQYGTSGKGEVEGQLFLFDEGEV